MNRIITFLLFISVFLNIYFFQKTPEVKKIIKSCHDYKSSKNQSQKLATVPNVQNSQPIIPSKEEKAVMPFDFSDEEVTENLMKFEQEYQNETKNFFIDKLKLNQEVAEQYFALQKARQDEINQFYTKKYEEPGFEPEEMYFSDADDEVERAQITEKYLIKLKALLGPDGYKNLKRFNKDYLKKAHEDKRLFHLIEF